MNILDYDIYVVFFSGGKDSAACVLNLLDMGVPKKKIELHHHLIDGLSVDFLMDWPVTDSYCRSFAAAMGMPLYFSWKDGGFEREMLRENALTAPTSFDNPDGTVTSVGGTRGKKNTRLKFPQVSANLSVRWCSAYLKIDVGSCVIRNSERFKGARTLVITGERAEESAARAKYKTFEAHYADLRNGKKYKRHVDWWRPVHAWKEDRVWDIAKAYKINPHPAYHLGFGRLSCMTCIFANPNQIASVRDISNVRFQRIVDYEKKFGVTIQRDKSWVEAVTKGQPYEAIVEEWVQAGMSLDFDKPVIVDEWVLPAGAFGDATGPT